jgi:hypothetical protein
MATVTTTTVPHLKGDSTKLRIRMRTKNGSGVIGPTNIALYTWSVTYENGESLVPIENESLRGLTQVEKDAVVFDGNKDDYAWVWLVIPGGQEDGHYQMLPSVTFRLHATLISDPREIFTPLIIPQVTT